MALPLSLSQPLFLVREAGRSSHTRYVLFNNIRQPPHFPISLVVQKMLWYMRNGNVKEVCSDWTREYSITLYSPHFPPSPCLVDFLENLPLIFSAAPVHSTSLYIVLSLSLSYYPFNFTFFAPSRLTTLSCMIYDRLASLGPLGYAPSFLHKPSTQ